MLLKNNVDITVVSVHLQQTNSEPKIKRFNYKIVKLDNLIVLRTGCRDCFIIFCTWCDMSVMI